MGDYTVATELFEISSKAGSLYYAPLLGIAFEADSRLINTICDIQEGKTHIAAENSHLKQLLATGIVTPKSKNQQNTSEHTVSFDSPFLPCEVTLFLTSNCNLACRYCYGNGGDSTAIMDQTVAFAAVDLLIRNAQQSNSKEIRVSFHGGGEPTLEFRQIQQVVQYTKAQTDSLDIAVAFGLTSNGMISRKYADWIIEYIDHLTISFDGTEDIQNYQRPTKGEKGSFQQVSETLKQLDGSDKQYCLRGTITNYCQERIGEIATFITENYKAHTIQLEPMFNVGRAVDSTVSSPASHHFVKGYLEAENICRRAGVTLKFSGHRFPHTSSSFCGIGRKNFAVTPEGVVTSCFEVLSENDPRSNMFFYGRFQAGTFVFDQKRVKALRQCSERLPEYCKDCFAQFHCTGDCRAKGLYISSLEEYKGGGRCEIIQELIKEKIIRYLGLTQD